MGLLCRREDNDDVGEDDNDFPKDTDTLEKERICIVEEGEIYSILLRKIYSMPHV